MPYEDQSSTPHGQSRTRTQTQNPVDEAHPQLGEDQTRYQNLDDEAQPQLGEDQTDGTTIQNHEPNHQFATTPPTPWTSGTEVSSNSDTARP